jgi:hypothetical protein
MLTNELGQDHRPSTFGLILLKPLPTVIYCAISITLTVGGFTLVEFVGGWGSWVAFWLGIALTGPLGAVALVILVLPVGRTLSQTAFGQGAMPPADQLAGTILPALIAVLIATLLVLAANLLIVRRWVYRTQAAIDQDEPRPVHRNVDRLAGSMLFIWAGAGFVLLCFASGLAAFIAPGTGNPVSAAQENHTLLVAAFTAGAGLVSAAAGAIIWIVFSRTGRAILVPAAIDFIVIAAGLTVILTDPVWHA